MRYSIVLTLCVIVTLTWSPALQAFPENQWAVRSGEELAVLRDYVCFGEGRSAERTLTKTVDFQREVLSAEVLISGFNIWQTRSGDTELRQVRVDAWVTQIGAGQTGAVSLKFMYSFKDEDPTGGEDLNDACIGFTVIARTKAAMAAVNQGLQLRVNVTPAAVSVGMKTRLDVTVWESDGRPAANAEIRISAGGGRFLQLGETFDAAARLQGPYEASGVTDSTGIYTTWWVCNPCAPAYGMRVSAQKKGFTAANAEATVKVQP